MEQSGIPSRRLSWIDPFGIPRFTGLNRGTAHNSLFARLHSGAATTDTSFLVGCPACASGHTKIDEVTGDDPR